MDALRQQPVFALDHEARKQIRDTRATVLEHLRAAPDDFKALVIADVLGEIDPDRDATLAAHRMRFRATRSADWQLRAKQLGLDRLLFGLACGMMRSRIGRDAVPVLERYAIAINEARASETPRGHIDSSYIPAELASDRRAIIEVHPSGHLARVAILVDKLHNGELVLAAQPGAGQFTLVEKRGGYGTMIREVYRDGNVVTTLNTPWHDGEESLAPKSWTRWIEENLADLARLSTLSRARKRKLR
jgi:hypothetical protein